jgi:DNA-binding transcriptional LysR family regulator
MYLSSRNENVISKLIKKNNLIFESLFTTKLHVFISKNNPLANKKKIKLTDLAPYPYLTYEQGDFNSFYFAEEPLTEIDFDCPKNIQVRDRATLFNLLIGLDGYTICSGVISHELNGPEIIARPLAVDDIMTVGLITRKGMALSRYAEAYIKAIKSVTLTKD